MNKDKRADAGGPEWTVDFLRSRLRDTNVTPATAEPPAVLGGYHKAAAVVVTFDPHTLKPIKDASGNSDTLEALVADSTVSFDSEGRPSWMLRPEVRRRSLEALGTRDAMLSALLANEPTPNTPLQRIFEAYLRGQGPDISKQQSDQLTSTLQACQWLAGIIPGLPEVTEVQRLVDRETLLKPFRYLVTEAFQGRADELTNLRSYVDYLPSEGIGESLSRGVSRAGRFALSWETKPPMIIYGPGGMGKSTLLAKFILDHVQPKDSSKPIPFVYLDFDRPSLVAEEPRTLIVEAARQLMIQFPEITYISDLHRSWTTGSGDTNRPTLKTMLDDFGRAFRPGSLEKLSILTEEPTLLVLDTFEEVQYKGLEFVAEVLLLLKDLQLEVPRLRSILVGRASVVMPGFETDNILLGNLKVEDSIKYLIARNVDPVVAQKVAEQVGGNPLSLRLAVEVIQLERATLNGIVDLQTQNALYRRVQDSRIQGQLYRRILGHIKDDNVCKLAHPGLVLRRVTPDLIFQVLAAPCGVNVPDLSAANRLFAGLQREVALVTAAEDGSLHHRPEVRQVMLELLRRDEPAKVREIQTRAVAYYRAKAITGAEKAELLYHLLALGKARDELEAAWEPGLNKYLGGILSELPASSRAFLAPRTGETLDDDAREHLDRRDAELEAAQRARDLLLLNRQEEALQALAIKADPGSRIWLLRAEALCQLARWPEASHAINAGFRSVTEFDDPTVLLQLTIVEARVNAVVGLDLGKLYSALVNAIPNGRDLLKIGASLGAELPEDPSGSPHSAITEILGWAIARNRIDDLITALAKTKPINPALASFVQEHRGHSNDQQMVESFERLVQRFGDDPRLLRVGIYLLQQLQRRATSDPLCQTRAEDLLAALFQRIPETELLSFEPLCRELAGRIGPRHTEILSTVLRLFRLPDRSAADRADLARAVMEWDLREQRQIALIAGLTEADGIAVDVHQSA